MSPNFEVFKRHRRAKVAQLQAEGWQIVKLRPSGFEQTRDGAIHRSITPVPDSWPLFAVLDRLDTTETE